MPSPFLHSRFEQQAAANPDALAVVCGQESLTFTQLNERANRLARRLIAEGVQPGDFVAVWAVRSIDTIVHLFAAVKAGGAYLPLDPSYPADRLTFMMGEAAARILLVPTGEYPPEELTLPTEGRGPLVLRSDGAAITETADAITNIEPRATECDLAYVIFTSGSTGQPKGVLIEHRAVVNTLDDLNERFGMGPNDRALCLSSFGFDLSIVDVFGLLGAGGAVVLPTEVEAREPAAWAKLFARHRITFWNSVPALMEWMVAYAETTDRAALASLRLAMLGGDWIPVSLPDRIRTLSPTARVVSIGGATEVAICSIWYPIERVAPQWRSIPYGKALRNQSIYVLDEQLRPVPVGTTGELFIGGVGVVRGYLNRPDLTAERFIADPFSREPGARLYRTGDLGRLFPDGNIEFLGRIDNQVKINGYRIELEEIEAMLARHPGIRDAAVVAPREAAGRRRLSAFFVPIDGADLSELQLREYLATVLPAYMVPTRFVALAALPLSANGKVDRGALSEPALAASRPQRDVVAPRNEVEKKVAAIWQEALKCDDVSMDDRFVEAGGDSLQMVDLMLRINASFGIDLPMATPLLNARTLGELAAGVAAAPAQRAAAKNPAARSPGARVPRDARPATIVGGRADAAAQSGLQRSSTLHAARTARRGGAIQGAECDC